jgi:hypothetical protein
MRYLSLREQPGAILKWKKPSPQKREFQLTDGQSLFASLTWDAARGTEAAGTTDEGRWRFQRRAARNFLDFKGLLQPRVRIEPAGGGEAFEVSPGYEETLTVGGENRFRWQLQPNIRSASFNRQDGEPLVTILFSAGAADGEVRLEPGAATVPELPLLVLLGWYALRDGAG